MNWINRIYLCLSLGSILFLVIQPAAANAISAQQQDVFNLGIHYFNTDSGAPASSCSTSVDLGLSGNGNDQIAFNFFVSNGFTESQAAGIVGNMKWESSVDPEKIQSGGESQDPNDAGSNGWGIVQWTPANTKVAGIVGDANISGPVYELGTQLQMVLAQLNGKAGGYSETQAGTDIKSTTTVEDAVRAFQGDDKIGGKYSGFERPKDEQATLQNRIDLANQVLQQYGGGNISGTDVSQPTSSMGSCSTSTGPGQDTQYVNGFVVYSQYDPAWANDKYGDTTIAIAGCGPSAMAMIITALTGQRITPDITAAYADSQNLYIAGEGSSWSISPVLAAHWSLNARPISSSVPDITAALQSGTLVIVSGEGPLPFTSAGHFIVIRGVAADGKWLIGDSGHDNTSTQEWDPQQLVVSMNNGSAYAISK